MKFTKQRKKIDELEKLIANEPNTELNQENRQTIQKAKEPTSKIKNSQSIIN